VFDVVFFIWRAARKFSDVFWIEPDSNRAVLYDWVIWVGLHHLDNRAGHTFEVDRVLYSIIGVQIHVPSYTEDGPERSIC